MTVRPVPAEASGFEVLFQHEHLQAGLAELADVFVRLCGMVDAGVADREGRALLRDGVVDGAAAQQDGQLRACLAQCTAEPEDGVVLLFQSSAVSVLDDVQNSHVYLVGMTSVLIDCRAMRRKSAGPPRFTPSTAFAAPRSSTHNPQLIQVSCALPLPARRSDSTNLRVTGWSSSSTDVPFTGFACGCWSFIGRHTAPS